MAEAKRTGPIDGRMLALEHVALQPAAPATRFILRATEEIRESMSDALGLSLPEKPRSSVAAGDIMAMWLGPDEWLVLGEISAGLSEKVAAFGDGACSVVDVSHRNCAILVSGSAAEDVIASGCPQDVSIAAFPTGTCTRTVLGKCEIVLFRAAADRFRIECWRSYSDYVWRFLADAAKCA